MKPVLRLRLHVTQSQPCFPAASNAFALPGGNLIFAATVNVNYIFKKKRNLMFRKNGIIFFRIFYESLEACDSQFAIL